MSPSETSFVTLLLLISSALCFQFCIRLSTTYYINIQNYVPLLQYAPKLGFFILSNLDTPSIHDNTLICVASIFPLSLACRVQASHPYMSRWVSPQQWPLSVWYPWLIPSFLALYVLPMAPIIFDYVLLYFLRFAALCYPRSHTTKHCKV